MQPTDRAAFKALLTDALAFWRRDVTTFTLDVWWKACETFDLEQVRKAFSAHAMDPERGQFAPMPADMVRLLQGTVTDRSLMAWSKVYEAMQRVGAYESVVFDDPAIHAAIEDCGGWVPMCRGEMDDLPFLQRRFTDAHKAYTRRGDFAYPPKLVGAHEQNNARLGHEGAKPVLIGNREAAKRVLIGGSESTRTPMRRLGAEELPALLLVNGGKK